MTFKWTGRPAFVALALTLGLAATAAADDDWGPGFKRCGSFKSGEYTIRVHAKGMTCTRATAMQREYWNGPGSRKVVVNGGSGADGYVKLKRYPGYKCFSGAGAGSCQNKSGSKTAAYDN